MRTVFPGPREVRRTLTMLKKLRRHEGWNGHNVTGFKAEEYRFMLLYKESHFQCQS